jgi:hypothetical protein
MLMIPLVRSKKSESANSPMYGTTGSRSPRSSRSWSSLGISQNMACPAETSYTLRACANVGQRKLVPAGGFTGSWKMLVGYSESTCRSQHVALDLRKLRTGRLVWLLSTKRSASSVNTRATTDVMFGAYQQMMTNGGSDTRTHCRWILNGK